MVGRDEGDENGKMGESGFKRPKKTDIGGR